MKYFRVNKNVSVSISANQDEIKSKRITIYREIAFVRLSINLPEHVNRKYIYIYICYALEIGLGKNKYPYGN